MPPVRDRDERATSIRELFELIAALDRRVPHIQRVGEASIARDAAALKAHALVRLKELGVEVGDDRSIVKDDAEQ